MINNFFDAEGATPLELDDINGLIPKHITTQNQLNEWEQANIFEAEKWVFACFARSGPKKLQTFNAFCQVINLRNKYSKLNLNPC